MAVLLCIETSTEICSVTLSEHHHILAQEESNEGNSHAEKLLPFIDNVFKKAALPIEKIDAVCISEGPGSYTGLRIGVSTAKGLCFTLHKPLIAVSTLQAMAWGAKEQFPDVDCYCPLIDARRMEVYCAVFDNELQIIEPIQNKIITTETFKEIIQKQSIVFSGNGLDKCKDVLWQHPNRLFADTKISARYLIALAHKKYEQQLFEDLAYFEPFYLKDFIAGKAHVKGL